MQLADDHSFLQPIREFWWIYKLEKSHDQFFSQFDRIRSPRDLDIFSKISNIDDFDGGSANFLHIPSSKEFKMTNDFFHEMNVICINST